MKDARIFKVTRTSGKVQYCKRNDILIQGRGSAANSVVCYALEITIVDSVLTELTARRFQHIAVNVYRDDMASRLGDRQGKPPVARAEIDHFGARGKSDCIQHGGRVGP